MNRSSWVGCVVLTVALLAGLDSYRRPYLERPYGPYLFEYYTESLAKARALDTSGRYTLSPEDRWHCFRGWEDVLSESTPPRARGRARRVQIIVPSGRPQRLTVRLDLFSLPERGRDPEPIVLEYGVNGVAAGRFQLPAGEPAILSFEVPEGSVFRGDNLVFLYRVTRRADPSAWLSLGPMEVIGDGREDGS